MKTPAILLTLATCLLSLPLLSMPSADELEKVKPLVQDLMKSDLDAMKLGKKSRADVAKSAMSLYPQAESQAAKLLLARSAFNLYVKAGEYEAAEKALDALLSAVPDYPALEQAELLEKALYPVPYKAAPNLRARLAAIKEKAQAAGQLKSLLTGFDSLSDGPKRKAAATRIAISYVSLGDWPNAVKYFALSDSPAASAAQAELHLAGEPEATRSYDKAANDWWSVELPKRDAKLALAFRAHAADLYTKALPTLIGLAKVQADRRIKEYEAELAAAATAGKSAITQEPAADRPYDVELDCLESDGGQWVETGFALSAKGKYSIEVKVSYVPSALEMDFWGNFGTPKPIVLGQFNGFVFLFNQGTSRLDGKPEKTAVTHVIRTDINGEKRSLYVDGSRIGTASCAISDGPLCLFAGGRNYKCARAKIHYFKIIKDGRSVLDMIPVKKGNEVFMYDKVSKRMIASSGARKLSAPAAN